MPLMVPAAVLPTVGEVLDHLGVTVSVDTGDVITSAVVIVETASGKASVGWSKGLSWPDRIGLLEAGQIITSDQ